MLFERPVIRSKKEIARCIIFHPGGKSCFYPGLFADYRTGFYIQIQIILISIFVPCPEIAVDFTQVRHTDVWQMKSMSSDAFANERQFA